MTKVTHISGRLTTLLLLAVLLLPLGGWNGGVLRAQHINGEVYGGGHNGTVSGSTELYISAGEIGNDSLVGTPYGGVFGAGEGATAIVAGNTQVYIAGGLFYNHIYGGGKKADLTGNANVNIFGGVIRVNVYGGSRLADVNGYAFVHVHDSTNTSSSPVLGTVYGGNDIGGNVKNTAGKAPAFYNALAAADKASEMPSAFVRISQTNAAKQPYIGNVFGGSDGGYTYVATATGYDITLPNNRYEVQKYGSSVISVETKPLIDRTYLEYDGGTVGNMFAGGDNVTVNYAANIHAACTGTVAATIPKKYLSVNNTKTVNDGFLSEFEADNYTVNGDNITFTYGINRCFGGNNNAAMNIRPSWFMRAANINNLYSGGNKGDMTYANGILVTVEGTGMKVQNVFGGCRLSDVHPTAGTITAETLDGFSFPAGYAARVLIKGGTVYNVYGGNDISGQVYHGANVVIRSDIVNNVYGSGNGSYAYRSNESAKSSDFYFQTNGLTGLEALKALNSHRPNTENVLIDLAGTSTNTTFIGGAVFCGGNSATLRDLTGSLEYARAKLKVGSYVISNQIFLGSNGEQMLNEEIIMGMNNHEYNTSIDLTQHEQMVEYMRGVEVAIKPSVEFAADYVDYSTYIGSLYCGGNKGSMSAAGTFNIDFLKKIVIYDKLVAGSNDANVAVKNDSKKLDNTTSALVNHSYVLGGLTTEAHPKVQLNITDLKLEPRRLVINNVETGEYELVWNRYQGIASEGDMKLYKTFLHGANIYGGCYSSGYVNGDVQINISNDVTTSDFNTEIAREIKADGTYTGKTGVVHNYDWNHHQFEPFISLLTCYGGGYGEETEIWGNTTINLTGSVRMMKARGGGERGWVGKMRRDATTGAILDEADKFKAYNYNDTTDYVEIEKKQVETAYDATVHLDADIIGDLADKTTVINNVSEICGGGFAGVVTGNTHALIDNGCVYTVFGGASNAHIYGSAEAIIGKNGRPYVTQTVYGANDFGGQIMGASVHETANTHTGSISKVKSNTYVEYIAGEIGYNTGEHTAPDSISPDFGIFGGSYGYYDYFTETGNKYYGQCVSKPNLMGNITIDQDGGVPEADFASNTFVNISTMTTDAQDKVMRIYGGGQGYPGQMGLACTRTTYVLINAANSNARPSFLAQYAFGAGDCAKTWISRLDAYSGNMRHLFGANRGVSYVQEVDDLGGGPSLVSSITKPAGGDKNLTYMGERSVLNVYPGMIAPQMDVFASGAFSGTKRTVLNLYGGEVHDVYGASIEEGITYLTEVNVPKGSTIKCNAIYGGGKGLYADRPCDTYITSINFHSEDATVEEAIYGGNCDYRFTRRTTIDIDVPVKNSLGKLVDVYGGGKGINTISEITFVTLENGAEVNNVFGGGCEGQVYNKPSVIQYMLTVDYYRNSYTTGDKDHSYCLGDCEIQGFNTWKNQDEIKNISLYAKSTTPMTIGSLAPLSMGYTSEVYDHNTEILINKGAVVAGNAYGAGYGKNAYTAGGTHIKLLGGTVLGNIYGGGYGGPVKDTLHIAGTTLANGIGPMVMNTKTEVYLNGGTCTNSFGSGYQGGVFGHTNTYVGRDYCGDSDDRVYYDGNPAIMRSVYGGGEEGSVDYAVNYSDNSNIDGTGKANMYIYYGHIGYKYDPTATYDSLKYVANLDYQTLNDSILYNNGNVFGGGYGEDANTINSVVNMYDGFVRNSLYGGGEIATIGRGKIQLEADNVTRTLKEITVPGSTQINMYGGHVLRDVFGGGRGYSFDLKGDEVVGNKFYADGYVFGKTKVNIYRGEIGTSDQKSLDLGYGNVFGGGNVGFVYSGEGTKATETSGKRTAGYYYKGSSDVMTEDCSVLISPYTKVTDPDGADVNGKHYAQCAYVPTEQLNYLLGKSNMADSLVWEKMDYLTGVTIHNAVFAGGNVTRGDSKLYADTKTVLGNAVAVLNDIYHRDLISVGTEHTGGIYGDGNLTSVDGFREICVANYGTDYYSLEAEITPKQYYALNDRERAYFQLMYKCVTSYGKYAKDQTISDDVYKKMDAAEQANWTQAGFCSVYAGRLLNTIQRADFVGVHGSRIVLQGAQDRTVSVADYMEYAINRVGEVSLNQRTSKIESKESADEKKHGNYFGFYNNVNFLKALTSDVLFDSERTTTSTQHPADGKSFYKFKLDNKNDYARNNATSPNKVALNSGVYLEIVDHLATASGDAGYNEGDKVYGPITGVVELDLMDLGENLGGAFVYAKNIHGARSGSMNEQAHITEYNNGARTHVGFTYGSIDQGIETSGNFVHPAKSIIDDCYPGSADVTSPGHYWFLRGSIYVYDQYISAYTGASTAYKSDVQIPLTIAAGSHGRLKILNIQPNLYAYYDKDYNKLTSGKGVVVNGVTYRLNDVVTYWDWSRMSPAEKLMFVHDTYIVMQNFSYTGAGGTVNVQKDDVMLSDEYAALPSDVTAEDGSTVSKSQAVRISNATSHTNGYALTADITNPADWDDRYVHVKDPNNIITKEAYEKLTDEQKKNYFVGPSYSATVGVYGQSDYSKGEIINEEIHGAYTKIPSGLMPAGQATVEQAYITTGEITYTYEGTKKTLMAGVGISKTEYDVAKLVPGNVDKLDEAYVCNGTLQLKESYIITGDLISTTMYNSLSSAQKNQFSKAYICTEAGKYGGTYYEGNQNYDALKGWCDLTADDRSHFTFNYDALDLFINDLDPTATIGAYDKPGSLTPYYDRVIELDYSAKCHTAATYRGNGATMDSSYAVGDLINRIQYEKVPNEMIHYSYLKASSGVPVNVVNTGFEYGDVVYSVGDTISAQRWTDIEHTAFASNITRLTFATGGIYYYCKDSYQVGGQGTVAGAYTYATNIYGTSKTYDINTEPIPVGAVISYDNYQHLPNLQKNFSITGVSPVETSTLYVARDANMADVQKDRVITVIYQYQYDESTTDNQMSTVTERHVVNIHLLFRSGAPSIGRLKVPGAVLPGATVGLKQPSVTKGAYEILGGGWEIYDNQADADNHINGQPYTNNKTVLYFYQTGKYVTYYAKTYLGKTYSNAVPLEVANYHSINDVMADTQHYMYIDELCPRNPKIYIDNDEFSKDGTKSELDLLKDLYDLSVQPSSPLNPRVIGCKGLDFILQDDVSPKKYTTWTPLGSDTQCFGADSYFHGDGHSVTGLDAPLFYNICGSVFNLGVKGSFTGAGVATMGHYAANCWVWNENAAGHTGRPILGNELAAENASTVVNSYYYEEADATVKYTSSDNSVRKNETAFNNGEVTYALNRYYLLKRYNDNAASKPTENPYSYWTVKADNTVQLHEDEGRYLTEDAFITVNYKDYSGTSLSKKLNYVEFRYWDGDFVNADGEIHTVADERYDNGYYYPIYPDDYIFFGQLLNYGYINGRSHDMHPQAVTRTDEHRLQTANTSSNRVYRATAYYGNMTKQVAHFNVGCVLPDMYNKEISKTTTEVVKTAAELGITITMSGSNIEVHTETLPNGDVKTTKVTTQDDLASQTRTITTEETVGRPTDVYHGMTAVDFTGHGDYGYEKGIGATSNILYTPITDYKTLVDFTNPGQTRNMLVYANSTDDASGYNVLSSFLYEPNLVYTNSTYKNIPKITSAVANAVQGHLIDKTSTGYVTDRNHFLVDENDFHCPIAYRMGADYRMWYQRTPCTFSSGENGYESIVLPFTATLVTAHQKGEITHFYDDDKANHEYWLRGFQGATTAAGVTTFNFIRPMASGVGADSRYQPMGSQYEVYNDFLYDYYYSYSAGQDDNKDVYQVYYKNYRSYNGYIPLTANVPFLLAFPGKKYYEFDMSGGFIPENTLSTVDRLEVQNVSFCSAKGAQIDVLPETGALQTVKDGYTFQGIFQKMDMNPIKNTVRVITTVGDQFATLDSIYRDKPKDQQSLRYMYPFHAYMVLPPSGVAQKFVLSKDATYTEEVKPLGDDLDISASNCRIRVENLTENDINIRIINSTGRLVFMMTLPPFATIIAPAGAPGVYLVNSHKIVVK